MKDQTLSRLVSCCVIALSIFNSQVTFAARPDSLTLTCEAVQNIVQRHGSATIATGPEFGTFYAQSCPGPSGNSSRAAYLRTKDIKFCFVGLYCSSTAVRGGNAPYFQGTDDMCSEGSTSIGSRVIGHRRRGKLITTSVLMICRDGVWTDPDAPVVPDPAPSVCNEGNETTSWRPFGHDPEGHPNYIPIHLVCHGNKWVRER